MSQQQQQGSQLSGGGAAPAAATAGITVAIQETISTAAVAVPPASQPSQVTGGAAGSQQQPAAVSGGTAAAAEEADKPQYNTAADAAESQPGGFALGQVASDEENEANESHCLMLMPDEGEAQGTVKEVVFRRDPDTSIEAAAKLMGTAATGAARDRIRCIHLPMLDKLHYALHMYLDLAGLEHGLPHNSNATQLFLIAELPQEPPDVVISSIHGPVILTAEDTATQSYIDLSAADWAKIKDVCRQVQPAAQFSG